MSADVGGGGVMRDVGVVIVAGGSGSRVGGTELKQLRWVAGKPMLLHSLQGFQGFIAPVFYSANFANIHQVTQGGHIAVQRHIFRQITDTFAHFHALLEHIVPCNQRLARCRRQKAGEHPHCGGFSRTVRAKKTGHLPRLGRK